MSAESVANTLHIHMNGETREIPRGATIESVIASDAPGIAVALNREVVPRARWAITTLNDNDELELVHAVQGG